MRKEAPAEKDMNPFDGKPRTAPARIRRVTLDGREVPVVPQEETMKVKLTVDYTVCRDGIHPESFKAEDEVDLPSPIASVLIEDGRAVPPGRVKMEGGAPENKMQRPPANKDAKDAVLVVQDIRHRVTGSVGQLKTAKEKAHGR